MAFDPVEGNVVRVVEFVQFDPVALVKDGLAVGFFPAPALPAGDPFGDAVLEVLAVGVQGDFRPFRREAQGHDGCQEFHAVIRRRRIAVRQLRHFAGSDIAGDDGPAAGPIGIAQARAIGIDDEILFLVGTERGRRYSCFG